jgi:diguanylate cyclase (GGDEF)-like protein
MDKFYSSVSASLSRYFARENASAGIGGVAAYLNKYGRTSLFEMLFVFTDDRGVTKEIKKSGITVVTKAALKGESVYPVKIDNGRIDGYLVISIKKIGDAELREGLGRYRSISLSLRFLYILLIIALAVILLYNEYSAKMRLARDIAEIKASNDGLTGLYTHDYFMKALEVEVERFRIYNTPIALLMLDIDGFKRFNDEFGHQAGDKVLQEVAKIIKLNTRATDILARYGGEEFAIIMPYTGRPDRRNNKRHLRNFVHEIREVAERIRWNLEGAKIEYMSYRLKVTISVGAAYYYRRNGALNSAVLLRKADTFLYKAKRLGKNRVCIDYGAADSL